MNATEAKLEVTVEPDGKRHRVSVSRDGTVLHVDRIDLASAHSRDRFLNVVTAKDPTVDRDALNDELIKKISVCDPSCPQELGQEVDVRRVVRPELFHTPDVSGITVPVTLDRAGQLSNVLSSG